MMKQLEIPWRSPLAVFRPLAKRNGAVILHGGEFAANADWSFIAAEPERRIESRNGQTFVDGEPVAGSPFSAIKSLHADRRAAAEFNCGAPLVSGLIGFIGYECGGFVEPNARGPASPYALPDFWFGAFDAIAAFDRGAKQAFLFGRSRAAIERLRDLLDDPETENAGAPIFVAAAPSVSRNDYYAAVAEVIRRIAAGELFQANFSQRLAAVAVQSFDPYALFSAASAASSAPYGAYLRLDEAQIVSQSPERFFSISRRQDDRLAILAEPIKGTRPRGLTPEDDRRLLAELSADPKDRAENVMIADLTRNDLSKICDNHTVREESICETMTLAAVHHLVSRISGVLRTGLSAVDALEALFPCGSVTGAPKPQAMKVIAEIERAGRGPYCGAFGYFDDRGGADMSVAIRIAIVEGARVTIPVGGGVTLRSDPLDEYEETIDKARQFLQLLGLDAPR